MTTSKAEWAAFAVGAPHPDHPKRFNGDCVQLDHISHVAHLNVALRIIADKRIRSGLIYDESRLRTDRTAVVWLSPNRWVDGSRYGNVSFDFDWRPLCAGKNAYWVEAISKYKPPAVRILLSDRDYPGLLRYDPTKGDGPWWHRSSDDTHWWNSDFTLEILFDEDLPLTRVHQVTFVKHHDRFCSSRDGCLSKGLAADEAATRLVAELSADGTDIEGGVNLGQRLPAIRRSDLELAWRTLVLRAMSRRVATWGSVTSPSSMNETYARAALRAVARADLPTLRNFASHFPNGEALVASWHQLVAQALPISIGSQPLPLDPD